MRQQTWLRKELWRVRHHTARKRAELGETFGFPVPSPAGSGGAGAFIATTIAFFLVEIGDKTQIATVGLAARFDALVAVIAGTTLGMMIANVPAVLFGEVLARKVPLKLVRSLAAASFVVLGVLVLLGADGGVLG
jgi:putative Ca2+/H+ antiporter (TMEM165/GDT1 family)